MRVDDKSGKEEYAMLYDQHSSYWQEKVVKEERTQKEHKYWVRMGTTKGLKSRVLMDLLHKEELKYQRVIEQGTGSTSNVTTTRKYPGHSKWMGCKFRTKHCE